jgi:hypothetical protein
MPAVGTSYLGAEYLGGYSEAAEQPPFPTGLTGLVDPAIEEFIAKQGDSGPPWIDHLSYSDGQAANLKGCVVQFVMRSLASRSPVSLTGRLEVPNPLAGSVLYSPSGTDTALAGDYMACWIVTYPSGEQMTFPTVGYRAVRIEPSLTAETQQLLSLPEVKDYLGIPQEDRAHDNRLLEHIQTVTALIENETGPIIPKVYDEWYDGGHPEIALRNRPSAGYGTTPVIELIEVTEYRGPIPYELIVAGSPAEGQIFSVQLDVRMGCITRRSAAGGVVPFWHNPQHGHQQIHVVYRAGQEQVPENVKMAAKEAIRVNYQTTQAVGRGRRTVADEEDVSQARLGFFMPRRCLELLAPTRRAPSIA